jgi:hypothetical protein
MSYSNFPEFELCLSCENVSGDYGRTVERRRTGLEPAEPLGGLDSCGRPVGEDVDREIVEGEVEHPGQGHDREEGWGRNSSRLDLAERLDRDTGGDGHLAQTC